MKKTYDLSKTGKIPGARIAIIQASWHKEITDRMVEAAANILENAECQAIDVYIVPGSYEIPLTAKKIAKTGKYEALFVFGVILKGETDHYDVIVQTCIRELGKVMYDWEIPVIMEILPVRDIEHAVARTQGENNKGIEAAQAAIDLISLYRKLQSPQIENKAQTSSLCAQL
ncbi:MAG TPA: 6,7-dimethyl-8-ribityllumazine synthase [Candidatus Obscuribacterales bacterium]